MPKDVSAKQQDTATTAAKPVNVVPLFRRRPVGEDEPETKFGLAAVNSATAIAEAPVCWTSAAATPRWPS